jgi:LuxR family maltose regulon positive regulatory protein
MSQGPRELRLLFLGPPIVELGDVPVKLETRKATTLLAYLALRPPGLRRDSLAALFWPEYGQSEALGNLRRTLASLNRSLPGGWLEADRETISLNPEAAVVSDVETFEGALRHSRSHCRADRPPCPECTRALAESADLYRGDFLEGLNLPDCPGFDDWQLAQREGLRAELGWVLERLVQGCFAAREWDLAAMYARRWVALDRLHEPAQRTLIELYTRTGQRSGAIQQYEAFARLLDEELGTEPEAATRELYNTAIEGRLETTERAGVAAPAESTRAVSEPLLRARIAVPPVRADVVLRDALVARLDREVEKRLVLVSAPPGFGKTTLLASWAVRADRPVAWASLDHEDNDPRVLLRTLIAALREVYPQLRAAPLELVGSTQLVPPRAVVAGLLNELAGTGAWAVLVLDDFHLLKQPAAQEVISAILDAPDGGLHLVIATRADPHLPIARLRACGELAELRAQDLRFGAEESAEFLRRTHGIEITAQQASALTERTEGWIAGLHMAALSLRGRRDVAAFVDSFGGSHRYILDYLGDEVLNRQRPDIKSFLCRTSILGRLCGPLCDTVTGRAGDSARILERLEEANLFIVPLDDSRTWYRYHHLFADLLRVRLVHGEADLVPALHGRASEWFEANGYVEEAIEHALAAKKPERVIRLLEQNLRFLAGGRHIHLAEWIAALPRELMEDKPLLYLLQASGLAARGRTQQAEPLLDAAEQRIPPADDSLQAQDMRGQIAGLRAHSASLRGDLASTIELTGLALRNLAPTSGTARATASYVLARANFTTGNFHEAERVLSALDAEEGQGSSPAPFMYALRVALWGNLLVIEGRLNEALSLCREAARRIEDRGGERFFLGGHVFAVLASICRERDELEEAGRLVERGIRLDSLWGNPAAAAFGLPTQARVLSAEGEFGKALEVLRQAGAALEDGESHPDLRSNLNAALVQAHLDAENPQAALRVAQENRFASPQSMVPWREQDQIGYARALIASHQIPEALGLLGALRRGAAGASRNARLIAILNLEALALWARGRRTASFSALRDSLALAAPQGFLRTFVDEGIAMRELLAEARQRLPGGLRLYAGGLLGAFRRSQTGS